MTKTGLEPMNFWERLGVGAIALVVLGFAGVIVGIFIWLFVLAIIAIGWWSLCLIPFAVVSYLVGYTVDRWEQT